jgi:hypothetical protein
MRAKDVSSKAKVTALATVSRGFDRGVAEVRADAGRARHGRRARRQLRRSGRNAGDDAGAFTEVYNIGGYGDSRREQKEAMQDYIRQAVRVAPPAVRCRP